MVAPSGEQFEISAGGYRAVVSEGGASLRALAYDGGALVDGFAESEMSSGVRGHLLMPWPNRIRDGRYAFDGRTHQLALTEPERGNAAHGLVRWAPWVLEEHTGNSVSLVHRLMAQDGYPWTVDLHVLYDVSGDGLTVTQTATNLSADPAPYACGAHPYLTVGSGPIDDWELTLPASTRVVCDPERLLPVDTEPVGPDLDFRVARPIRSAAFDDAFGDLDRDPAGVTTTELRGEGRGVALWGDRNVRWLQVYSGDDRPEAARRRSLAVEPMTAPPDAFNSGTDLVTLAPAGAAGSELSVSWGIRALEA